MLNKTLSSHNRKVNYRGLCMAKPQIIISHTLCTEITLIPSFPYPMHYEPGGIVNGHFISLFSIIKQPHNTSTSQYSLSSTLSITTRTLQCIFTANINSPFHGHFHIQSYSIISPLPSAVTWHVMGPLPRCELQKTQKIMSRHEYWNKICLSVNWSTRCVKMNVQNQLLFVLCPPNKWWFLGDIIKEQRNIESCALVKYMEMECVLITWNQITERTHISQWLHHSVWCWILAREHRHIDRWQLSVRDGAGADWYKYRFRADVRVEGVLGRPWCGCLENWQF